MTWILLNTKLHSAVLLARTAIAGGFLTLVIFIIKGKPRNSPQDLIMAQLLEFIWIHGMGSFLSLKTMSHWVWQLMDLMGNHFILWCLQLRQEQKWGCNVVHHHPFLCSIFVVQRLANIYQILKLLRLYPYHLGWNDIFVMNLIGSSRSTFPHKWRKPVTLICDVCVLKHFNLYQGWNFIIKWKWCLYFKLKSRWEKWSRTAEPLKGVMY